MIDNFYLAAKDISISCSKKAGSVSLEESLSTTPPFLFLCIYTCMQRDLSMYSVGVVLLCQLAPASTLHYLLTHCFSIFTSDVYEDFIIL